jgi:hypothetical protein
MPVQQFRQELLMNGYFPIPQGGQLLLVIVYENDLVPKVSETGSSYQSDIS